jgi:general stress protein 26
MTDRRFPSRAHRQLKKLLRGMTVGMLTTHTRTGETRSRPMLVQDLDEQGCLWFMTDRSSRVAGELSRNSEAVVIFQSPKGDRYLSVHGTAVVIQDAKKLKQIWNPTYRTWYPKGKKDREIVLVALRIETVDYWMVPRSRLTRVVGAAKAILTGKRYETAHGSLRVA